MGDVDYRIEAFEKETSLQKENLLQLLKALTAKYNVEWNGQ